MTKRKAIAIAALVIVLAGCGVSNPKQGETQPNSEASATTAASPSKPPSASVAKMGTDTVNLPGKITVTSSVPERYTPSHFGEGYATREDAIIKFQMTATNQSETPFDGNNLYMEVTIGGVPGHAIYDCERGICDNLGKIIPPGRPLTATLIYAASTKDTSVIDVTMRTMVDYETIAIFRGAVA